ncbi:SRPBCC domain-containing protein [Gulosibacter hominis]|uniref:SRPBCC domain-containing protein n=1 Tax=Gulosibacter hominis TaxID=2770504 RepID=UPI0019198804|nr:SRPBCC domain-containing protein [Gulosibacter hominis]
MTHAQLTVRDGSPAVRLSAQFPIPAGKLWSQALTPEGLATWFPFQVEFAPEIGSRITFTDKTSDASTNFTGEITSLRDPEELAFTFGENSHVTMTLNSDGKETTFAVVERLANENEAARNAASWHAAVSKLERLHGVDSPELDWNTIYERYVDEGFPTGAAVPGIDEETLV